MEQGKKALDQLAQAEDEVKKMEGCTWRDGNRLPTQPADGSGSVPEVFPETEESQSTGSQKESRAWWQKLGFGRKKSADSAFDDDKLDDVRIPRPVTPPKTPPRKGGGSGGDGVGVNQNSIKAASPTKEEALRYQREHAKKVPSPSNPGAGGG